jgi:hypothetical protein
MARNGRNGNEKRLATQQSVNGAIKSICDIMRWSNCAGARAGLEGAPLKSKRPRLSPEPVADRESLVPNSEQILSYKV